ncbi:glycosyltransferase family 2 protein [Parabacteroides johnsonii]|jgi:glycosyltransferase, family 2|nr:glycosyltransferase family 2 protein [Parabacteroides johnsonii]
MLDLSVIILAGNEEIHMKRCLDRITPYVKEVFVIDCYSTDRTVEIAQGYENVTILQNKWVNYATQFNWALQNAPIKTEWVLKLDADEYLELALIERMQKELPMIPDDISAISIRLKHMFLGKFIKGGTGKKYMTRIFRKGRAVSENRQMDEHMKLTSGELIVWEEAFYDDNFNNLKWWTNKHNGYAIREAADLLDIEYNLTNNEKNGLEGQAASQRSMKHRYAKMPLFWRAFIYFFIRYFLKGGMFEGKEGFLWCFLQGWWYRTLVDALIFEIKQKTGGDKEKIRELLKVEYDIHL